MFCTHCGAEIEPGFSYCTRCGASLQAGDATSVVGGPSRNDDRRSVNAWLDDDSSQDADAWLHDDSQFGSDRNASVYTDQSTAYFPPITVSAPVSYRAANPSTPVRPVEMPSEKKSKGGTSRGSAIAIVVLLLVALGILIGLLAAILAGDLDVDDIGTAANELVSGLSDNALDTESVAASNSDDEADESDEDEDEDEDATSAQDADEEDTSSDDEADETEDTSATLTDSEAYSALASAYAALSSYNSQISDVATDFNNYYAATSYDTRSSYAAEAESVLAAVTAAYEDVLALAISESSSYYSTWEDICSLYYYLQQRIAVMCEAWEVSLSYDDPSGHQDEILAPIVAARGDDGSNRYLSAYNALYSSAEPEAPSE